MIRPADIRQTTLRLAYPRTVRPPVRTNFHWRQPLPQRSVLQPHALPNGSIPNRPETYNGGHGTGVGFKKKTYQKFYVLFYFIFEFRSLNAFFIAV